MDALKAFIAKFNAQILNPTIYLLFAVALAVFMWGLVEYIANAKSDEGRGKGRQHMIWGIIGMFIMVAAVGIIQILLNTFGITTGVPPFN